MKNFKLILGFLFFTSYSFTQYEQYLPFIEPYLTQPIESGFFHFNEQNSIQPGQLYQLYKINAPDLDNDMLLTKVSIDSFVNMSHYT
jgi:hypothetical protein